MQGKEMKQELWGRNWNTDHGVMWLLTWSSWLAQLGFLYTPKLPATVGACLNNKHISRTRTHPTIMSTEIQWKRLLSWASFFQCNLWQVAKGYLMKSLNSYFTDMKLLYTGNWPIENMYEYIWHNNRKLSCVICIFYIIFLKCFWCWFYIVILLYRMKSYHKQNWGYCKVLLDIQSFFSLAANNGEMGLTLFNFFDLLLQLLMSGLWMFSDSLGVLHTGHKDLGEGQDTVNFESSFSTSHCLLWGLARFLKYWSRKAIFSKCACF